MRRRQFLVLSASSIGGVLVYSLDRRVSRLFAQEKTTQTLKIPLRFFTEEEAMIVAAAASRIFPSDDSGPGAKEAGVVIFIDRQLAGPYGRDRYRYTQGPFDENAPREFGYQGKATPRETYRAGLKGLKGFDRLPPDEQDKKLQQIENTHFFAVLRQNTIEGMFSDPVHGGNVDMVGWQLVGFPGPRMSNYADIDKHFGEAFRPRPITLEQAIGRKVRPSEDEETKS
ncbi:MAG TPA: gluconate 2-dehydrogenase subunit 3 family protein [Candidatus Acidoferrales bacterium]|nr:gluconate 2-dehydrogenase subunit 3 family protein [Candidatus Acidoferrales bacterium]